MTLLSSANEVWVGRRNAGHPPSFHLSGHPSVRPNCECDISLEPVHQFTLNLRYEIIPGKGRMLLILGRLLKTRWMSSNFLKCMQCQSYRHPL